MKSASMLSSKQQQSSSSQQSSSKQGPSSMVTSAPSNNSNNSASKALPSNRMTYSQKIKGGSSNISPSSSSNNPNNNNHTNKNNNDPPLSSIFFKSSRQKNLSTEFPLLPSVMGRTSSNNNTATANNSGILNNFHHSMVDSSTCPAAPNSSSSSSTFCINNSNANGSSSNATNPWNKGITSIIMGKSSSKTSGEDAASSFPNAIVINKIDPAINKMESSSNNKIIDNPSVPSVSNSAILQSTDPIPIPNLESTSIDANNVVSYGGEESPQWKLAENMLKKVVEEGLDADDEKLLSSVSVKVDEEDSNVAPSELVLIDEFLASPSSTSSTVNNACSSSNPNVTSTSKRSFFNHPTFPPSSNVNNGATSRRKSSVTSSSSNFPHPSELEDQDGGDGCCRLANSFGDLSLINHHHTHHEKILAGEKDQQPDHELLLLSGMNNSNSNEEGLMMDKWFDESNVNQYLDSSFINELQVAVDDANYNVDIGNQEEDGAHQNITMMTSPAVQTSNSSNMANTAASYGGLVGDSSTSNNNNFSNFNSNLSTENTTSEYFSNFLIDEEGMKGGGNSSNNSNSNLVNSLVFFPFPKGNNNAASTSKGSENNLKISPCCSGASAPPVPNTLSSSSSSSACCSQCYLPLVFGNSSTSNVNSNVNNGVSSSKSFMIGDISTTCEGIHHESNSMNLNDNGGDLKNSAPSNVRSSSVPYLSSIGSNFNSVSNRRSSTVINVNTNGNGNSFSNNALSSPSSASSPLSSNNNNNNISNNNSNNNITQLLAPPAPKKVYSEIEVNRFASVELEQISNQIYALCKDQYGCRYLQRKLEESVHDPSNPSLDIIFKHVFPNIIELMTDPFGNYLCQKLLEYCWDDQRTCIVQRVSQDIMRISLNMHGTRAVQKMIEYLSNERQVEMVIAALCSNVVALIKDLNGNHVIQKCLNRFIPADNQFIYDAVTLHCNQVATHRHGCCVLQRCIDHASMEQQAQLVNEIISNSLVLVQDPFGNYVVQYVLDLGKYEFEVKLIEQFIGHVCELSVQKFSSNVIEKCIRVSGKIVLQGSFPSTNATAFTNQLPALKKKLIGELISSDDTLEKLLCDSYGNYVVQTALDHADAEQRQALVDRIKPILPSIRNTPYGKRLYNKLLMNSGGATGTSSSSNGVSAQQQSTSHHGGSHHHHGNHHHHQHSHHHSNSGNGGGGHPSSMGQHNMQQHQSNQHHHSNQHHQHNQHHMGNGNTNSSSSNNNHNYYPAWNNSNTNYY